MADKPINLTNSTAAETVCVAGGLALMVLGAGLIAAHPSIRRLLETGLTQLAPTIENPLSVNLGGVIPRHGTLFADQDYVI